MALLIGRDQTIGPYRILRVIGSGGFGTVYEGLDTRTRTRVAIKVPHHQDRGPEYLMYEPGMLERLHHPNIVRLIEVTQYEGIFFFVMEFVPGRSLSQRLDEERMLPWQEAVRIIEQVAEAIRFAHEHRILHRDLRPANILIREDGVIKVADFGIAKWLKDTNYAHTVIGSPPYMAPEQLEGKATFSSDIYSIGIIFYETVTGQLPFFDVNLKVLRQKILQGRCPTPHQLRPEIPIPISQLIMKAMHRLRSQRFQTADEFLQALRMAVRQATPAPSPSVRLHGMDRMVNPSANGARQLRRICWNCARLLHARTTICPACGESQR